MDFGMRGIGNGCFAAVNAKARLIYNQEHGEVQDYVHSTSRGNIISCPVCLINTLAGAVWCRGVITPVHCPSEPTAINPCNQLCLSLYFKFEPLLLSSTSFILLMILNPPSKRANKE